MTPPVSLRPATRLFLAIVVIAAMTSASAYVRGVYEREPHAAGRTIPGTAWNVVPLLCFGALALLLVFRLRSRSAGVAASTSAVIAAGVVAGAHWFWQSTWPLTLQGTSQAESLLVFVPLAAIIIGVGAGRIAFHFAGSVISQNA